MDDFFCSAFRNRRIPKCVFFYIWRMSFAECLAKFQKSLYIVGIALAAVFFTACSDIFSDSSNSLSPVEFSNVKFDVDLLDKDFVRLYSKGHFATLGTDDSMAVPNEIPKMRATFDYDFSIGKHEVTCEEFNKFAKAKKSTLKRKLDCSSKNLPATNITYYDAVLLANAKSNEKGLDTVYTYVRASYDGYGNCENLEGLVFHPEVDAYRLPTEAEWVLAASQGWNPEESWNADNSKYKLHSVCGKEKNDIGLCDMAGNAMEWVHDWMGFFRDSSVNDFVGGLGDKGIGERILKGGSFRNNTSSMNLYNRNDVYAVTSSTKANYVGVRLARGAIPSPEWLAESGRSDYSKLYVVANSATLQKMTGTFKMKLVFRNDVSGNLSFIDYSQNVPVITEIKDTLDSYHPDISPDGKRVAFCTGLEGVKGKSQVYVRDLDEKGSHLLKLDVENAAIPRWRVLDSGDTVIVYVTDAGNNSDEASWKSQSTWQVPFAKGKFGKPRKLFDGTFHGGVSRHGTIAASGSQRLRAHLEYGSRVRDTVWYNGEQVCNVSLLNDFKTKVLFLDFGSKTGKDFVGEKYNAHERLFVMDSTGKLIQSFVSPSGYTFDHSEWALNRASPGQKFYAVVSLVNGNGAHVKLSLLDMATNTLTEMVNGDELWHPCFWIGPFQKRTESYDLDVDSAGVYLNSLEDSKDAIMMRYKMELLWTYKNRATIIFLGSSRPMYALSPNFFKGNHFAINLAHTPNSIYAIRDFYLNYIETQASGLDYLVVSLDIDFWNKIDGEGDDNFFATTYKKFPGYVYDENHNYWKDYFPPDLPKLTKKAIGLDTSESKTYMAELGRYIANPCKSWGGKKPEIEEDSTLFDNHPELINNSLAALDTIIKVAANRNVTVIGIIFPQSPAYKKTGAFGRYGMRRSLAKNVIERIERMSQIYSNFFFWDRNKMGNHDYGDHLATDYDHLCQEGTILMSVQLDSLIREMEKRNK